MPQIRHASPPCASPSRTRTAGWSRLLPVCILTALAGMANIGQAVEVGSAQAVPTTRSTTGMGSAGTAAWVDGRIMPADPQVDAQLAQLWGLTPAEIGRARMLMRGPRSTFSPPTISPIEVLGIHARDDAERQKYAKAFAKMRLDDVLRELAWQNAAGPELRRLTEGYPVIDFTNAPMAEASPEVADAAGVPRQKLRPSRQVKLRAPMRAPVSKATGKAADNNPHSAAH